MADTVLEVAGLRISVGPRVLVEDVGFSIARGQTLALVGESGSGKSLTALSLLRLLPAGIGIVGGRIHIAGHDIATATPRALRRLRGGQAGMVFQEPMTSLNPLHRIGRQVAEAIALHRAMPRAAQMAATRDLLAQCGLPDARLDAFPHQLSGGQRQRVMIAMALANNPALLIADEPTTALDVTIQAQILELLAAQKAARGLAMLLISHDLGLVRRFADQVAVMQDGRIVETGATEAIFAAPRHATTRALLAARPGGAPPPVPQTAAQILDVRNLVVGYPGGGFWPGARRNLVPAVRDVSFALRAGETLALVGESGSGKTTIGLALLRLLVSEGQMWFGGARIDTLGQTALRPSRARMQVVFQDPFASLSPRMDIGAIIGEGLAVHQQRLDRAARAGLVAQALAEVGLDASMAGRFPHEFSGGQRQRIAIARAMVLRPQLVVLDEPTSALDRTVQMQIIALLRDLQARHGLAYLFISHDLAVVRAMAHRVVILRAGQIEEAGPAAQIFSAPRAAYTRALLNAAFDLHGG